MKLLGNSLAVDQLNSTETHLPGFSKPTLLEAAS